MRSKDIEKNMKKRYSKNGDDLLIIGFDANRFANFLMPKNIEYELKI